MIPDKIYLVIRNYNNGVDTWETVEHAFLDKTAAELKALELDENAKRSGDIQYYVHDYPIEG